MVFVRKVPDRSGATKVQIAQRRARRDVVLETIGTAHDDAELALLMDVARARVRPGQQALDLGLEDAPGEAGRSPGVITSKRCALLWEVLTSAYARLGFDVLDDEAFMQVVLARLVEPTSKADSVRVLDEIGVPHVDVRTFFRALNRAVERDYRGQIAAACFAHAARHGDLTLVLYDVTTLYFEAEHEDELRKVGYSKERRVDPQVVVGLLVDRGGFPLEITCWEGNKAETATLLPTIRAFAERHDLANMVVVADAGMLFVTIKGGAAVLNDKDLQRARSLAGLKGYVTNIPASVMPAAEVIASYHDLWRVEQSFRMSKTDLRARPMFHHDRDAIQAHLTVVMTALALARHLQELTGLSLKKIIRTLRPLQEITVTIAGHEHLAADPLTPAAKHILETTGHPRST